MNSSVKAYITTWDIICCADNHFRRVIYGIGPYIANYPEQSTTAGTVYGWCDADPTDLDGSLAKLCTLSQFLTLLETEDEDFLWFGHGIVPDFLIYMSFAPQISTHHQAIKGTFKDHLVTWVENYLKLTYGTSRGLEILDEID
ncbi:hypothetical protein BJ322DRAFT_1020092 [Thelephora terrestris]|uniref:Uncharacterized protein n=1 Tax=Thelephora terrestris TaxID=56493 RepID=A0A9P6HF45_9AGAM|nr:hypothetical protein BJ322DRAFT_1020092 [Thelephora terrestris]